MRKKLRAVVAGCGWGANHMRGFAESERSELGAIWSHSDKPSNRGLAAAYRVPFYTDFDLMLEREKPDMVSVATPEASHCGLVVKALTSGAHVYCEKVLATNMEDASRMADAAKRAGKELGVGYNYRYSPSCRFLSEKVKSGAIGRPLFAMLRAFSCCAHHMTDYVTSIFGDPEESVAVIDDKLPEGRTQFVSPVVFPTFAYTPMTAKACMIRYKNGATLLAAATDFSGADSPAASLTIEGTEGRIELDDLCGEVALYKTEAPFSGDRLRTVYAPSQILDKIGLAGNCVAAVKDFAEAMSGGNRAPIPASDGIRMIAIEESVWKSAKTRKWEPVRI